MEDQEDIVFSDEFAEFMKQTKHVRIPNKPVLNVFEAAAYTGIGINRLAKLEKAKDCNFIIYKGSQRLFVREKFVDYLEKKRSI